MNPIDPSVMALADFLIFLFEEKKLAPVSVKDIGQPFHPS